MNSIVLDGSVNKDERMNHWTSQHKRIIFATPQAFKNDVFKGDTLTDSPERRPLRISLWLPPCHGRLKVTMLQSRQSASFFW